MNGNRINREENMRMFRTIVWIIIIFAIIAGWLNIPSSIVDSVIAKIVLGPLLGIFTGAIAGTYAELIDRLTNGLLKEEWTFTLFDIEISIPIFVIVTLTIEIFLFRF
jgi:hypothetical protein|tara:strand:- start:117 stop:440 length:324 start_codon:yes stop_codon:yes gene_type:complete